MQSFSLKTCGFFLSKRQTGPGWSGELIRIDRLSGVSYLFIYVIREPDGYALDHLVFSFIVQLLRTTIVLLCLHLMGVAGWEWHCQAWSKCILLGVGFTAFSIWIAHTSDCSYWTILGANKLPSHTVQQKWHSMQVRRPRQRKYML